LLNFTDLGKGICITYNRCQIQFRAFGAAYWI
jgi:hypothetical protein